MIHTRIINSSTVLFLNIILFNELVVFARDYGASSSIDRDPQGTVGSRLVGWSWHSSPTFPPSQ